MRVKLIAFHPSDAYYGHSEGERLLGEEYEVLEKYGMFETHYGYFSFHVATDEPSLRERVFYAAKYEEVNEERPEEVPEEE